MTTNKHDCSKWCVREYATALVLLTGKPYNECLTFAKARMFFDHYGRDRMVVIESYEFGRIAVHHSGLESGRHPISCYCPEHRHAPFKADGPGRGASFKRRGRRK